MRTRNGITGCGNQTLGKIFMGKVFISPLNGSDSAINVKLLLLPFLLFVFAVMGCEPEIDVPYRSDLQGLALEPDSPANPASNESTGATESETRRDRVQGWQVGSSPWLAIDRMPLRTWSVVEQVGGSRPIGSAKETISLPSINNQLVQLDLESFTRTRVDDEITSQLFELHVIESRTGLLQRFDSKLTLGASVTKVDASIIDDQVVLKINRDGKTVTKKLTWLNTSRGPFAVAQSLLRAPMMEGEVRKFSYIDPLLHEMADVMLVGEGEQAMLLDNKSVVCRSVRQYTKLPQGQSENLLLVRPDGVIGMSIVVRHTEEGSDVPLRFINSSESLAQSVVDYYSLVDQKSPSFVVSDLNRDREVRLLVTLGENDPFQVFPKTDLQRVESRTATKGVVVLTQPKTYELSDVISLEKDPSAYSARVRANLRVDSNMMIVTHRATKPITEKNEQVTAADIVAHCKEKFTEVTSRPFVRRAFELERATKANFIEHAIYFAALARANGIPSRMVVGLKLTDAESGKFSPFAWNEVFDGYDWIPLDVIDGGNVTEIDRITMFLSDLNSDNPYRELASVVELANSMTVTKSK